MSFGAIYNPPVPFTTPFPNGLSDGSLVVITGTVLPSGDRFAVNFQCGPKENDDIAFHFNPRFIDGGIVVCNTKEHQSWGREENKREMPFHKGQPFEIRVLATHHSYKVSVNRNHFLEYNHRTPLHKVKILNICGSVSLTSVDIQAQGAGFPGQQFPPGQMHNPVYPQHPGFAPQQFPGGPAFNPGFPSAPMQSANYTMPYQTNIYGGLFPSKTIVIRGTVNGHPKRFHINLKFSGGTALHFNPRFDENTIVRNSFLNNSWGKEERHLPGHGMCFAPGQSFVIEIVSDHHAFRVNANGHHVCDFQHRVHNLQQIDTLQIEGDVVLQHVQI
ncbi:galectin-9-like [Spea bombifrons]|uniref:galectin-9-like n=1 Tax=Spea bombifrons TaxID=233779 RepID=UPI00234A6705|nr:galectin-9-like [Spea bombifrons]